MISGVMIACVSVSSFTSSQIVLVSLVVDALDGDVDGLVARNLG
jgi:hypothetical protein